MWLFTIDGFFSIVQDKYCASDEVMVRARCKEDLINLLNRIGLAKSEILEINYADYRFRVKLKKKNLANAVSETIMQINYPNFKNTLDYHDYNRYIAYSECWKAMHQWQKSKDR